MWKDFRDAIDEVDRVGAERLVLQTHVCRVGLVFASRVCHVRLGELSSLGQ